MKKIAFQLIGQYNRISNDTGEKNQTRIHIDSEFKNALLRLNCFSHCVLFTKEEDQLSCYTAKIIEIDEISGDLTVELAKEGDADIKGDLVDIKPFFPCEEVVDCCESQARTNQEYFTPLVFKGKPIGEFLHISNRAVIQIRETEGLTADEIEKSLAQLQPGDYVRVLWWFHRLDDKKYRRHLMCNPPYEKAPKCGVFATRSPVRPNPIASTVVKVIQVDRYNHHLSVWGFDGFEHSPIMQIMPYGGESPENVVVPEWLRHWTPYKVFHAASKNDPVPDFSEDHKPVFTEDAFFAELEREGNFEETDHGIHEIVVEGARLHNLKNITVRIPKEKITVITGVSGSGKSSLAFDTIFHESQKQYMDLIAANSPVFSDLKDSMVTRITGLQPAIAIEQRNLGTNPRSTVASMTRIGNYLRLLFATIGERTCPNCDAKVPPNNVCDVCNRQFRIEISY